MKLKTALGIVKNYIKQYGIIKTFKKILQVIYRKLRGGKWISSQKERYQEWIINHEPKEEELEKQRNEQFSIMPKISIVIPMYNTPILYFKQLVESIKKQTYSNFELCLADGSKEKNEEIEEIVKTDERIKYEFLNENKGIAGNSNAALKLATGDYIALVDHDDLIPPFCLYEVVKAINEDVDVEFIYSDEDKIDQNNNFRYDPHFKPDFAIDTLRSNNYITHLSVFKKELMEKIGGFRDKYDGAQDYDIILRAVENTTKIVHIPKVLYHWRVHRNSTAMLSDAKPYAYEAGLKAIKDHLERQNLKAKVSHGNDMHGVYQVEYELEKEPKVSILIPNKDGVKLLKQCINSILNLTTYPNYEIVVIENNSCKKETFEYYNELQEKNGISTETKNVLSQDEKCRKQHKVRIVYYKEKGFNYSKIINFGVKQCEDSDFILQLNNDTKLLTPNFLEKMIGFASRKDVGAVGARLYYKDNTIQHAGIAIGIGGLAANLFVNLPKNIHGYFGRECTTRNVSAVTGACLLTRRKIYEEVGFMDEENFAVAFNDVDFCLKIRKKGYLIVYNPYVELMHYESKTRGYEDTKEKKERFEKEATAFRNKWKSVIEKGDPYFSINFSKSSALCDIEP